MAAIDRHSWLLKLDRSDSSILVLATLTALAVAGLILYRLGMIGRIFQVFGTVIRATIRSGFLLWERLFAWASWTLFLFIVLILLIVGGALSGPLPSLTILFSLVPLFMGLTACLAYMFIDLERYEVERGYKAVYNPLKGQEPAEYLARYGHQVDVYLLIAATVGMIGGFALLNQGLYETIGHSWFKVGEKEGGPVFTDFLAYALINLLNIINVLNLADTHEVMRTAYLRQAEWPASVLLGAFRVFFTFVLLQQIFASVRQGKLLAEMITDFWSPHEPIHERACNALPQYGSMAIDPLLASLREIPALTREQREQLPLILATIGPSTIPALLRQLDDTHEHVRAVAVAALGHLHAIDAVPLLARLGRDSSEIVRQSLVEALGTLASESKQPAYVKRRIPLGLGSWKAGINWVLRRNRLRPVLKRQDPVALAVTTLETALTDEATAVRSLATQALGRIGPAATAVTPKVIALLKDEDETVRCFAADAVAKMGGNVEASVAALAELLQDPSAPVKAAAARALGSFKKAAAPAVQALMPLLKDREDSVRQAAAEAMAQVGLLSGETTDTLVEGLNSPDHLVRAQTADALAAIGPGAEEAVPALVEAMVGNNDRVRAKAVKALGKIGESAAEAAVPSLVRALRDKDTWISALAAEALGEMGESADGAIPALVRSLGHRNPQVRANAAEALGKMGEAAAAAQSSLEKACTDEDGGVRSQAIRALGTLGKSGRSSGRLVLEAFQDADPLVRAAAVAAVGLWGKPSAADPGTLLSLLEDANDQVKVEVTRVLPLLAGATPEVIDGLCRRVLEDDSSWVQVNAALALGKLGPAAAAAGGPLLAAAQTGEVNVREQAMRAIAMIQPPETCAAFLIGLKDASGDIRKVASGGWIKAEAIPDEVIPALVAALRDPEIQVRANACHALARIDSLPPDAVPLLMACADHASDSLRMNAAMALRLAPARDVEKLMEHLTEDANARIRLIAASFLLTADKDHPGANAVLRDALSDPSPRARRAALDLIGSHAELGGTFREYLAKRQEVEEEPELRENVARILQSAEANP